ncbi:hypothetical protein BJ878DRAFT_422135, partial [Calycina marina]
PVSFNVQELASHTAEKESMSNVGEISRLFRENRGRPPNGMVGPIEFHQVLTVVAKLGTSFIEDADEAGRELFAKLRP